MSVNNGPGSSSGRGVPSEVVGLPQHLSPCLNTGITFDVIHSEGGILVWRDFFKNQYDNRPPFHP